MPDAIESRTIGPLTISGPYRVPRSQSGSRQTMWGVMAVDTMTEETAEKIFETFTKAKGFITELAAGVSAPNPLADDPDDPPRTRRLANRTPSPVAASTPTLTKSHTRRGEGKGGPGTEGAKDPDASPFNLTAVADALVQEGLDPFVEVARVMQQRVPVTDHEGKPVLDKDGEPLTKPVVHGLERAKILLELGQYIAPKLKSVEMKVENKASLPIEELDRRIEKMLAGRVAVPMGEVIELPSSEPPK